MPLQTNGRITRTDLEVAFSRAWGDGYAKANTIVPQAMLIGGAIALGAITVAFLLGKRRGRRKSSVVEIRRI